MRKTGVCTGFPDRGRSERRNGDATSVAFPRRSTRLQARLFLLLLALPALASTPSFFDVTTFTDFLKGKFDGIAIARDGHLTLAPKIETFFNSEQPVIWDIAEGPAGAVYAATGHNGRVYRVDRDGKGTLLWTADRPEVFAIAADPKGIVYAATSPDGKIWRIDSNANGKATEYFDPQSRYIWSLALASDGTLYAGTGDGGRVFRITAAGKGEEYFPTGQGNVTSLLLDPKGRLLAGTEPNGILFRITAKDQATVLYDSTLPEIHAVAADPDGNIYAVGMGGALAKKTSTPPSSTGATPDTNITSTTSITVTADAGGDLKPPPAPVKPPAATPATPAESTTSATTSTDTTNVEKSAIYRINPDDTVNTLWSSKEENVYDVAPVKDGIIFGTDVNGRIYRLSKDRRLTLLAQTNESEIVRLRNALFTTANMGRIYRIGPPSERASYESSVFDAGGVARWGKLRAQTTGSVVFQTRSGRSARPDSTWSAWAPLNQTQIASPNARYLQFSAELTGPGAEIDNVSAAYLPLNTAPTIRSITVISTPAPATATQPAANKTTPTFSVTVTDTGDATPVSSTGTATQTISHAPAEQITISWQADDPENDKLVFSLDFRGEGETIWKQIKEDLHDTSYSIDADALPDGRYYFRVTASDRESNPVDAKETELVSSPVLIDNAPPVIRIQSSTRTGNAMDIAFEAQDAASPIHRAEWSIDAGHWNPIAPVDGILDSPTEQFRLHIDAVPPGEHLLVIRVADTAGNTGLGKVVIR